MGSHRQSILREDKLHFVAILQNCLLTLPYELPVDECAILGEVLEPGQWCQVWGGDALQTGWSGVGGHVFG